MSEEKMEQSDRISELNDTRISDSVQDDSKKQGSMNRRTFFQGAAGILATMALGSCSWQEFFQNNPEATAEWALGSALEVIERWNAVKSLDQLFYVQSLLNVLNEVAETGSVAISNHSDVSVPPRL